MKTLILIAMIVATCFQSTLAQTSAKDQKKDAFEYYASLAGKIKGSISKEEILTSKGLLLEKNPQQKFHIISFKMTLISKGKSGIREYDNPKNAELNPSMIEGIKNASTGDKLYFEYIKIVDNSNNIDAAQNANPLSFTLN